MEQGAASTPQAGIPRWLVIAFAVKLIVIAAIVAGVIWWANR